MFHPKRANISGQSTSSFLTDVQVMLRADETLWELLQSPLVLSIVALTYHDRSANALRVPGTPGQRLTRLFEAYTERMFEHRLGSFGPHQMRQWLAWLARSMRDRGQTEFHLDRLQRDWLPTKTQQRLVILMSVIGLGLVSGLVGLVSGLSFGLVFGPVGDLLDAVLFGALGLVMGLFLGLFSGLFLGRKERGPVEEIHWSWSKLRGDLVSRLSWSKLRSELLSDQSGGLLSSLVLGLVLGLVGMLVYRQVGMLFLGLVFGLASGLASGLVFGPTEERFTPNEGIHRSARHALVFGLVGGLSVGLVGGLGFGLSYGVSFGLFFGLYYGGVAFLQHLALRSLLAYHRFAPLHYVRFLDEATERLFLRQVGSGYVFVHRLLLDYFADLDTTHPQAGVEQPVTLSG